MDSKINHYHLEKVVFDGFSMSNAKKGEKVKILIKAMLTSDDLHFYEYIEKISNILITPTGILINNIYHFLALIHKDKSADIYINNFQVEAEIQVKRSVKKREAITINNIADIKGIKFPDIKINNSDKIICCLKVGWKFVLYFDLNYERNLNIGLIQRELGRLYRYLKFQHVYKTLENDEQFTEMLNNGWFPFIEILGDGYKKISGFYKNKFNFDNNMKEFVDSFNESKIVKITEKWWNNELFKEKRELLGAGLDAYLQDDAKGFISCIKNLLPEIDGIIRIHYFKNTNKAKATFKDLLEHVLSQGKVKSGYDYSLFLPKPFFRYLDEIYLADFNLKTGKLDLSRHSSGHGVAKVEEYKKDKALQIILILDQIYFYLS